MDNPFFTNKGPFKISKILSLLDVSNDIVKDNIDINNITDLMSANENDITFFHSKKYNEIAKKTKASFCITTI
jgi:UDP-3-O-[3-hydroxymyristoyl] glucosamine N-acyltransferase